MQKSAGKPVVGAVLGAAVGILAILILQQGAVLFPTRLVVFSILGAGASLGSLVLTRSFRSTAVVCVQSVAAALVAFSLTGISALDATGDLTGDCTVTAATASSGVVTPGDTSLRHPFAIDTAGTLEWRAATPVWYPKWSGTIGLEVGGFEVPMWNQRMENPWGDVGRGDTEDVAALMHEAEQLSGLTVSGVYHVFASISADEGACTANAYVAIPPPSLFSGPVLEGLWTALAIAVLIFAAYVVQLRAPARSRERRESTHP